ncbi:MAG: zinc ribbon domain-containing protein [Clostridiales bacterium]|jgi:hypothetical protein|nr:zinc ribbon domain-containing protein [Clostridiales bacterium]
MYCKICGQAVDAHANVCHHCGADLRPTQTQGAYTGQYGRATPIYHHTNAGETAPVMTVGQALSFFLLPTLLSAFTCGIGGFVLILVWAFGSNTNPNKRNLARAQLIVYIISFFLVILPLFIAGSLLGVSGTQIFEELQNFA